MQLSGKAVLITGGSRGLGRALGQSLAKRGAHVVLVARDAPTLETAVQDLRQTGAQAYGIVADLGDKEAIHRIAAQASALVGPIDVLIHNASSLGPTPLRLLLDTECEDFERVLQVNLLGPFRLSKALLGSMLLRQQGLVVHISSDAAVEAYPQWGAYSASKAALDQLSRVWAAELASQGISVLAIDPGELDTDMHHAALPDADRSLLAAPEVVAERIVAKWLDAQPPLSGSRLRAQDIGAPT